MEIFEYEERHLCCFVIDTSNSMAKSENNYPIDEVNNSLQHFHNEIKNSSVLSSKVEITVVSFSSTVELIQEPSLSTQFDMPKFSASGSTQLISGVRRGIKIVKERKFWYRQTHMPYLRPWIFLITDGKTDSSQDMNALTKEIETESKNKEYRFLPIGVEGAHMDLLNQIAGYAKMPSDDWGKMEAMKLKDINFLTFFEWCMGSGSISITHAADTDTIDFSNLNKWWGGHENI